MVYRRQSTVHCDPNTNGKQTTETIIIAVSISPVQTHNSATSTLTLVITRRQGWVLMWRTNPGQTSTCQRRQPSLIVSRKEIVPKFFFLFATDVAPTTTAAPTTAAPATTGASSGESMGTMMEGVMDCTCMPNMTAMHEDMQMMESMMSASGRAIRYVKK